MTLGLLNLNGKSQKKLKAFGLSVLALVVAQLSELAHADVSVTGAVTPSPLCLICVGDINLNLSGQQLTVGIPINGLPTEGSVTVTHDSGATHLITTQPIIGQDALGELSLVGRDTTWTSSLTAIIGDRYGYLDQSAGIGVVELSRAATWESQGVVLGNQPGTEGTVILHEPGTLGDPMPRESEGGLDNPDFGPTWINSELMIVGAGGTGTAHIKDGDVSTDALAVGFFGGSTGVVTLESRFANLVSNKGVLVGVEGDGTLNVLSSTLTTNSVLFDQIGIPAHNIISAGAGSGTVTVDGAGSKWTAHGGDVPVPTIVVGGGEGTAELIVSNGGVVQTVADGITPTYIAVGPNGVIKGDGTIISDVIVSGGTVAPGLSPGTLNIDGDYTQSIDSELLIEIAGTNPGEFDVLNVLGAATFESGSTIKLDFTNGFAPSVGDQFDFLLAHAFASDMSLINYAVLGLDPAFELDAGLSDIGTFSITVLNDGMSAVPIPGAVWLFGSGLLGLVGMARRKKA